MYDFYQYKQKKRHSQTSVIQTDISHFKTKTIHIRVDKQLDKNLEDLAAELGQDKSKVARDILTDHFLEENHKAWLKEVAEWNLFEGKNKF